MRPEEENEFAQKIAKKVIEEFEKQVYENVGKSFLRRVLGMLLLGVGVGAFVMAIKFGLIKV